MITSAIEIYKLYETYKYGTTIYRYIKNYIDRKNKIKEEASKANVNAEGWELL